MNVVRSAIEAESSATLSTCIMSQPMSFERNIQMVAGQVIHTNYYSRNYFPGHYCNSSADTKSNIFREKFTNGSRSGNSHKLLFM